MRRKLYTIIEPAEEGDKLSAAYDYMMMAAIALSVLPLAFKQTNVFFVWSDRITAGIFILDYIFRLFTADYKLKKSAASFFLYPFTPMAIIDCLSVLPSLSIINESMRVLKLLRFFRMLKILRVFKILRYSKSFIIIANVFKRQKRVLAAVATTAIGYVFISALIIYNVEPESFNTFFDAIYWATISLTTVGYGDIYAVTTVGRIVTMVSSIFGIAIIALPSGVITAGYLEEINKDRKDENNPE